MGGPADTHRWTLRKLSAFRIAEFVEDCRGCRGQPAGSLTQQNRMKTPALTDLACRIRQWMTRSLGQASGDVGAGSAGGAAVLEEEFNALALELYAQQLAHNAAYRALSQPEELGTVRHWRLITPVPAAAFKELEMTSLPAGQRTSVFCSSGSFTTSRALCPCLTGGGR